MSTPRRHTLPALFAAVLCGLTQDFLLVAPQFSVTVSDPLHPRGTSL